MRSPTAAAAAAASLLASGALAANATYDYIVVGGGTSGLVAATRFAETGASVLLLERGEPVTHNMGFNETVSWNDTVSVVDLPAMGYVARSLLPFDAMCADTASNAGCVLGGGGSVNAEMFVPPHAADFAAWPAGWRWEDGMAEAAARVHARNPGSSEPSLDGEYYNGDVFELLGGFLGENGWKEVNAIEQPDEKHDIYAHPPWNIQDAVRAGPVRTYLPQALTLPNFTLQLHSKAVRVVRSGGTATGVEIEHTLTGARTTISLRNPTTTGKIVLAAGALTTPRLLVSSGIGPASQIALVANDTTAAISLPPRATWLDLPVGQQIQDHPIFYINLNLTASFAATANLTVYDPTAPLAADSALYNARGAGPLAQGAQRFSFWTSRTTMEPANETASGAPEPATRFFQGTVTLDAPDVVGLKIYLTRGLTSRGAIALNASAPSPATARNFFSVKPWIRTRGDRDAVVAFLNEVVELFGADADARWVPVDYRTGKKLEAGGADVLLQSHSAGAHFVGTTRLGDVVECAKETGPRVKGMENLFVVDAGIFAEVPTGNTNAVVMVVAEHAAELIVASA